MIKKALFSALLMGLFVIGGAATVSAQSAQKGKDENATVATSEPTSEKALSETQTMEHLARTNPEAYELKKKIQILKNGRQEAVNAGKNPEKYDLKIRDLESSLKTKLEDGQSTITH